MSLIDIKIDLKLDIENTKDLVDTFAKNVTNQLRNKLGASVNYKINFDEVIIMIEKVGEKKQNIPYKIINGKIIVPKEYQKYLSKDGRSLNINKDSDYENTIQNLDLNIF